MYANKSIPIYEYIPVCEYENETINAEIFKYTVQDHSTSAWGPATRLGIELIEVSFYLGWAGIDSSQAGAQPTKYGSVQPQYMRIPTDHACSLLQHQ